MDQSFFDDVREALVPGKTGEFVWIDRPFLWLYCKWRVAGWPHSDVMDGLRAPDASDGLNETDRQALQDGVGFLERLFAGPVNAGPPDPPPAKAERHAASKVLEGSYLSPLDLARLPKEKVRFSTIITLVRERRVKSPDDIERGSANPVPGVSIEETPQNVYRVHRRIETGFASVSDPMSFDVPCLEDAVRFQLYDMWGSETSSLPIDWEA